MNVKTSTASVSVRFHCAYEAYNFTLEPVYISSYFVFHLLWMLSDLFEKDYGK